MGDLEFDEMDLAFAAATVVGFLGVVILPGLVAAGAATAVSGAATIVGEALGTAGAATRFSNPVRTSVPNGLGGRNTYDAAGKLVASWTRNAHGGRTTWR